MVVSRARVILLVLVVLLVTLGTWMWSRSKASIPLQSTPVLTVDTSHLGVEFQVGAVGLATETIEFRRGHLTVGYPALVRLMRLLGPSVLRIGGSSVDLSWWTSSGEAAPQWATSTVTPTDLLALHKLLSATGWRVLLGVNLGHFEPARAANEARYAHEILGAGLMGIEIGNEPNAYSDTKNKVVLRPTTYDVSEYTREVQAYSQAVGQEVPGVPIYGPAAGGSEWLRSMGAAAHMFTEITQHFYPTTACPTVPASEPRSTVAELLSPLVLQRENEALEDLGQAANMTGRPTRISETNSVSYCSESPAATPSLGSALWALDWTLRATSTGVEGMNFYGGFGLCGSGSKSQSPICAPGQSRGRLAASPEYYGLLAATRLEGGRFAPTSLKASRALPNIMTWATVTTHGTVRIAIENLALSGPGQQLLIPVAGSAATVETLTGPSPYSGEGVTFGGAAVTKAQEWRPHPQGLSQAHGYVRLAVRPGSAVVVTLREPAL